jgi:hypothetical protein
MTSVSPLIARPLSPDDQPLPIDGPARPAAGPAASGEDDPPSSPFVLASAPGQ